MDAGAGRGDDIFCFGLCGVWFWGLGFWRTSERTLEGLDRFLEGEALRAQHVGGRRTAVADNRGQDNGAVDFATAALAGGGGGRFQDAFQVARQRDLSRAGRTQVEAAQVLGDVGFQ